jgi:hypothetical protein
MKEQPSLYIEINVDDINGMSDQELAEYLSARLAEVEPKVLTLVNKYRGFLAITDDIFASDGQVHIPMMQLLDHNAILVQQIRRMADVHQKGYCTGPHSGRKYVTVTGKARTSFVFDAVRRWIADGASLPVPPYVVLVSPESF